MNTKDNKLYQETLQRIYSVAKLWFEDGCKESPQKMAEIIKREYKKLF